LRDDLAFFGTSLSNLFFPPVCAICNSAKPQSNSAMCPTCQEAVEPIEPPFCFQCGLPFRGLLNSHSQLCGRCLTDPPLYFSARYGVRYQSELRNALIRFKFYGDLHAGRALSELLIHAFCRHFEAKEFSLIVPVPIHRRRLIQRGFNQTVIMAEKLSGATGIPLDRTSLQKIKDTLPQVGLPRLERIKNVKGSFGVRNASRIRDARVLIVDDVATTGSTINEAAKTLIRGGAARVDALVLALRLAPGSAEVDKQIFPQGN